MRKQNGGSRPFGSIGAFLASDCQRPWVSLLCWWLIRPRPVLRNSVFEGSTPNASSLIWLAGTDSCRHWEGKFHDIPSVTVRIGRNGDQLTGTVMFNLY
jgi:hypothetical protein